ncbi:MAG: glutathione S-transferase [Methylovulum sp.]|nr:glutathione S-transferase [Methylovulum sp.]MDD2724358.1 glutathione S-transferase [Methylovulum sp.]
MLTLYQFPISHYCEKARWALDYKRLDYKIKNLFPGLHVMTAKRLAGASSLPILVHDGKVVQGSGEIIDYLEQVFPEHKLAPADDTLLADVLAWEKFVDGKIGVAVRIVCYHVLLDHPDILTPFFTRNAPWYGSIYMKIAFPNVAARMRGLMNINDRTAALANRQLARGIAKLSERLQHRPFLAGDTFTRADLSAAALLAPLCKRPEFGLQWPGRFPGPLEEIIGQYAEQLAWVHEVYNNYRRPKPSSKI